MTQYDRYVDMYLRYVSHKPGLIGAAQLADAAHAFATRLIDIANPVMKRTLTTMETEFKKQMERL